MTVVAVDKDPTTRTLRITAEFPAPVERVWQLWADPRVLERWWGPPTHPATVEEHDLTSGGRVAYFMTGPDGDRSHGWWKVLVVEPPHHLELQDGFADAEGTPNPDLPITEMRVDIAAVNLGTRMTITSTFPSIAAMEQLVSMGMDEGMSLAVGQIDGILAELSTNTVTFDGAR
jgi:uncharacterized protein YndB with AHSA1/START domain